MLNCSVSLNLTEIPSPFPWPPLFLRWIFLGLGQKAAVRIYEKDLPACGYLKLKRRTIPATMATHTRTPHLAGNCLAVAFYVAISLEMG